MIKAIFFDIDETLLPHVTHKIPDSVFRAFGLLRERGILTFTCTGRSLFELEELGVTRLPFDGHVVLSGQLCLGRNNEVLYSRAFEEDDLERLKKLYDSKEFTIAIVQEDGNFVNMIDDDFVRIKSRVGSSPHPIRDHIEGDVYQATLFGNADDKLRKYFSDFRNIKCLWWHKECTDITVDGEGKAAGMKVMMEHYGFSRDEIMAFGDSQNDTEMMNFAGLSVCMGNGTDDIKAISDYVTGNCSEDGIYDALKHFEII